MTPISEARFARKYSPMPEVFQYPNLIVLPLGPGLEGAKEPYSRFPFDYSIN